MLHDDRDVGFEYRGIVGVARDRLRVVEIIEAQVQRAAGGDGHAVRADRLPVGEENRDRDARVALPGIENAGGERSMRGRKRSFRRECNLRRLPIAGVQWPPCRASVFPTKMDNADARSFVSRRRNFFLRPA